MHLRRSSLILAALATVSLSSAASAQSLAGKVTDAQNSQPLAGARVSIGGGAQGAIVRSDGTYRLPVAAGTYIIRVSALGYTPITDTVIVGGSGATARLRAPAPLPPGVIAARSAACAANTP